MLYEGTVSLSLHMQRQGEKKSFVSRPETLKGIHVVVGGVVRQNSACRLAAHA